jgi:PKD repeat protein
MVIPTASNFPDDFDSNENLYEVHDGLRVRLAEDYSPGDTSITIEGDSVIIDTFPSSGIITLTEQCSPIDKRALTFHYDSRTDTTFDGLELFEGFSDDTAKPKRLTNVTQNVVADHHNNLKDAIIAVEEFIGIRGTVDSRPFGSTMEGRINFLHRVVLKPGAWFSVDKRIGLVPLTVEFKDLSFRTATGCPVGTVTFEWDFGDQTTSVISVITATSVVPTTAVNVVVQDLDGGTIEKTYTSPGIFDVTLTISDNFGEDTVVFPELINARIAAPNEATIEITPNAAQELDAGTGILRTPTNSLVALEVPSGINPEEPDRTFAGELVDGSGDPIDPITTYTWFLSDDLTHGNIQETKASYSIGGLKDIVLRVDTDFGTYRITTLEDQIDVIETFNLWLWTAPNPFTPNAVQAFEFGLINETFKVGGGTSLSLPRDDSFLDGTNNEEQAKREFLRNNGFAPRSSLGSGNRGSTALLYWASGRDAIAAVGTEDIVFNTFNGFLDTYTATDTITRPWNWADWASPTNVHFLLGNVDGIILPDTSPTNQNKTTLGLSALSKTTSVFSPASYLNGAEELLENVATYVEDTIPDDGYFAVHRTTWRNSTGYLLRNSSVGDFFRIQNFYRTEGTALDEFQTIRKLPDMAGTAKIEGQLVSLSTGVFFFNNSGAISAFNPASGVWETGGPGVNAASFRSLQDSSVADFDELSNTLVAASDGDRRAYLSYDYSTSAFTKFNEADLTFSALGSRPSGEQWLAGVY